MRCRRWFSAVYEAGSAAGWQIVSEQQLPTYPWLHVLSSGDAFYSGPSQTTALFSTATWTPYGATSSNYGGRYGGMSVLLPGQPDRVMVIGGQNNGVVTATAEIIDLADPSPGWRYTQPLASVRARRGCWRRNAPSPDEA